MRRSRINHPLGCVIERITDVQIFWYDADHGFNCDERASYNPDAAKLARERSLAFLRKNLM